jgi:hypothetical protein
MERTKFRPSPLRGFKDAIAPYPSLLNHKKGLARKVMLGVRRKEYLRLTMPCDYPKGSSSLPKATPSDALR